MKIRLTANGKAITASLIASGDTRFVSLLPLTLTMKGLVGREKFGHLTESAVRAIGRAALGDDARAKRNGPSSGGRSWGHFGGNVAGAARDVRLPADHISPPLVHFAQEDRPLPVDC
jgi:hypothetical protein